MLDSGFNCGDFSFFGLVFGFFFNFFWLFEVFLEPCVLFLLLLVSFPSVLLLGTTMLSCFLIVLIGLSPSKST